MEESAKTKDGARNQKEKFLEKMATKVVEVTEVAASEAHSKDSAEAIAQETDISEVDNKDLRHNWAVVPRFQLLLRAVPFCFCLITSSSRQ